MFYDQFVKLCKERGMSPAAVTKEIGLNNSSSTAWKRGSIPKGDTLQKLADYFGVSVDFLLGNVQTGAGGTLPERAVRPISSTDRLMLREMEGLTEEDKQLVLAMIDRLKYR